MKGDGLYSGAGVFMTIKSTPQHLTENCSSSTSVVGVQFVSNKGEVFNNDQL